MELIFGFDKEDLLANAENKLTAKQEHKLKQYRKTIRIGLWLSFFAIGGTLAFFAGMIIFSGSEGIQTALPYLIIVAIIFLSIYSLTVLYIFYQARNLYRGLVSSVNGIAQKKTQKVRNFPAYYVTIGKKRFQLQSQKQYDAFSENTAYTVHYIDYPPTHIILSVTNVSL